MKAPEMALPGGGRMPMLGMGTFGSDKYGAAEISDAVYGAVAAGYRLFDCASVYGNERDIGAVLERAMADQLVARDELFVMSKVWNDMHGRGEVLISLATTLRDLRLDRLDAYFLHWPFPNYHAPGCDGDSRNPDSVPFSVDRFMATWRQLERAQQMGLTRYIGMSNMTVKKLEAVLPLCEVMPALIEMELHPSFQQQELFDYCREKGIAVIGYCPMGSPSRPERDKAPGDVVDFELPEVASVAKGHGVHPAEVCLKWAVQRGQVAIPFSVSREKYVANLRAVTEDPLTDDEMALLKGAERGCRLVKGQVFLWEGATDWRDLWE